MRLEIIGIRGNAIESVHPIAAARVQYPENIIEIVTEDLRTTWRSAAKPFQLTVTAPVVSNLVALEEEQLAIGAASHHGRPDQIYQVERLLEKTGLGIEHLMCGIHWPLDISEGRALAYKEQVPSVLHNNCSGKHAFMAAACKYNGQEMDYRPAAHPLQYEIWQLLSHYSAFQADICIDGCGVPCFIHPLSAMARAWSQLAHHVAEQDSWLGKIGRAMNQFPRLVGGEEAVDTLLMEYATEKVIAKLGAEGLLCIALPERKQAVVIKALSGSEHARLFGAFTLIHRWFPGLLPEEILRTKQRIQNWSGMDCGQWVAKFS